MNSSPHNFHIPVMGLAFTIDSPVKVAQYGISSAISVMEDRLTEMMRKHYYPLINKSYFPISTSEENYREKRITDYLNLVSRIVSEQIEKLKNSVFENGSDIVKYFEMLPEDGMLKQLYRQMTGTVDTAEKEKLAEILKSEIRPGSIDVNIMTKLDKENYSKQGNLVENGSDALAALKGYAKSNLKNSSLIFSAGLNPRLYNYLEKFSEFDADDNGEFEKKIVIKVSDYRSALIQGKYLAKKGKWVSEFRIESGLNCGGHAFATEGHLMGPILNEFKTKKEELSLSLFELYNKALQLKTSKTFDKPHPIKITVQGGIGTYKEAKLLQDYYQMSSTGWGTPFLLVPEATTVDISTIEQLQKAKKKDLFLSKNSPLGVPFYYLKGTSSDKEKKESPEALAQKSTW
jgi:DNA-directed RNA polymerase subunit F